MENAREMEIFKDIKGYPNYQISNKGRIWSKYRNRYLKPFVNNSGYEMINIMAVNGKRKGELIHRLVALAFVDNPNQYPEVNHLDENKLNNEASNLEWCTRKQNNNYGQHNAKMSATIKAQYAKHKKVI